MTSPVATVIAFVSLAVVVSAVVYMVIASVQRLWPFPPDDDEEDEVEPGCCPVCGEPVSICAAFQTDPGSGVRPDAWSGVDPRHGDDGNSGHG